MKLRKLLYSIKMYKFYRIKVNSKKVVIASVSEAIQYLLDCFVAAFYFHFLRTALEIIHLAMTARVFFKFKYTPQLAVVSFIRVIPDSDLLYSIIVIPTYVYI